MTGQFVPVKLDAEHAGKQVAAKYKVNGFPTIIFLDPSQASSEGGGLVSKIVGYLPPDSFAGQLENVKLVQERPQLEEQHKLHPDDVATLGKLVVAYHIGEDDTRARKLLEEAEKVDPDNAQGHLTAALNAVADSYQTAHEFDKAIPLFRKAAKTGRGASEIAYARESIAACYLEQGKPEEAITELEAAQQIESLSQAEKAQIEQLMKMARSLHKRDNKEEKDAGP